MSPATCPRPLAGEERGPLRSDGKGEGVSRDVEAVKSLRWSDLSGERREPKRAAGPSLALRAFVTAKAPLELSLPSAPLLTPSSPPSRFAAWVPFFSRRREKTKSNVRRPPSSAGGRRQV